MANVYLGARSPKGNVGVRGVADSGELSAYTPGVLSGFNANSVSSFTINIGGVSGTQDVAIAQNTNGESELLVSTAGQSLAFIIGGAPGTAGQSRTDALVAYKDTTITSTVNDAIDAVNYVVIAGTAATTGTQVPPTMSAIRAAITNGSVAFISILGYVTIANGASGVTTGNFTSNSAVSLLAPVVVANATERNYLPLIAGLECYQVDTAMKQWCDGTNWINIPRLLKKVILTANGDLISVTGIPLRDNLQIKIYGKASGAIAPLIRFNNDSTTDYSYQASYSGGAWAATASANNSPIQPANASEAYSFYAVMDLLNSASDFKIMNTNSYDCFGTNASTSLNFAEYRAKYASNVQVTRVDLINGGSGDLAAGSYVEIWG